MTDDIQQMFLMIGIVCAVSFILGYLTGEYFGQKRAFKVFKREFIAYNDRLKTQLSDQATKFKQVVADYKELADRFMALTDDNS